MTPPQRLGVWKPRASIKPSFGCSLRIIGPSKLAILRTLPLPYRFVHPSIGGSKILRVVVFYYRFHGETLIFFIKSPSSGWLFTYDSYTTVTEIWGPWTIHTKTHTHPYKNHRKIYSLGIQSYAIYSQIMIWVLNHLLSILRR